MFSMLTVGCISFSFFSPLAMPPLHKTVCSGASLVTGEYTKVAFMRVWTPIYLSWTLYTFSIFILFLIFIFRLSLLLSFSSLNLAPVYIFLLCLIHKSHLQLFILQIIPGFCRSDRYIWLLIFFIFRLSMRNTHVIGELINSYARILSCVFWRQIQTEKKLSLNHL